MTIDYQIEPLNLTKYNVGNKPKSQRNFGVGNITD